MAQSPLGPTAKMELESPRLRQVSLHFADVERPNAVIAAAAIFRANKILDDRMSAALADVDLTPARYELLGLLENTGGAMSLRELGRILLHHPATMTYTIDVLEKRKLIKRKADKSDRRAVLAQITPAGSELVKQSTELLSTIEWGLPEFDEDAAGLLAEMLSKLHPA